MIGTVRVDNSLNQYSPASLIFVVEQSGSCSTTITMGATTGVEVDALYAKASLTFGLEVSDQVSWTEGIRIETESSVPPRQIGKVTGYVVGIYSGGTATYILENPATNKITYEYVGTGGIIPTTRNWNLVVEIPCS